LSTQNNIGRTPIARILARTGYGAGEFGFALIWNGARLFLLFAYTELFGIPAALAGTIILVALVWDAISDPLVAMLAERNRSRWGRYRPLIALGAPFAALGYGLMFFAPALGPGALVAWALVTHLLFRSAYTLAAIPYNALIARVTVNPDERVRLSGARVIGLALAIIAVATITPIIADRSPTSLRDGYALAAALVAITALAGLWTCTATLREPNTDHQPRLTIAEQVNALQHFLKANIPYTIVLTLMALLTLAQGLFMTGLVYFTRFVMTEPSAEQTALSLAIPAFALIPASAVWVWLGTRWEHAQTFGAGALVALLGFGLLALAPNTMMQLTALFIIGTGLTAIPVTIWAMAAACVDYGEEQTGTRVEAGAFALLTFTQKTMTGLAAFLTGLALSVAGFVEGGESQSEAARMVIVWTTASLPLVLLALALLFLRYYRLSRLRHALIVAAISKPAFSSRQEEER
jgi:GPH family glycoside/pentoside/hexuronide:cation symporter